MKKLAAAIFCFVFTLGFVPASIAQDNTATNQTATNTDPDNRAVSPQEQAIVDSVGRSKTLYGEISTIGSSLSNLSGEELAAAVIQLRDKSTALVKELRQFGQLATVYTNGGGDLNVLLQADRDNLLRAGGLLRQNVTDSINRMEHNNLNRDTLSAEGLKAYESDTKLIDLSFNLLSEYVDIVKTTGFDPTPSIVFFQENLPIRAQFIASRIALSQDRQQEYKKILAASPTDTTTQQNISFVTQKLAIDTQSLKLTIELANKLDLNMSHYQTILVRATGEINSDLLNLEVIKTLLKDWWVDTKFSIQKNSVSYLIKGLIFVLILVGFRILASFVKKVIRRSLKSKRMRVSILFQNMVVAISSKVIMLIGLLVALSQLGVSLAPVLAGLGVAGFIVGFALQDTLSNFASGMMILFYRPYDVGDAVEVAGGVFGKVRNMSIVSTTILTFDNQTLIIPNSKIWGDVIKNITAQYSRRVDMTFGVSYNDDIPKVESILKDIINSHEKILKEPEPIIKLNNLGDSSMNFIVRPWVQTDDYWDVYWDVTREVKIRFDREGISIPFPQQDIYLHQAPTKTT